MSTLRNILGFNLLLTFLVLGSVPQRTVAGEKQGLDSDSVSVYIFLLESCPISRSITIELRDLHSLFESKGFTFLGLFPNATLSDDKSIAEFKQKYKIPFELRMDEQQRLTDKFNVGITPEVVVVRNSDGKILYRGAVDNSFESVGRRRGVTTDRYLNTALMQILYNETIEPKATKPVGCIITKTTPKP